MPNQPVKNIILFWLLGFIASGCAVIRNADVSGFHSTLNPKLNIIVNNHAKYLGSFDANLDDRKRTLYNYVVYDEQNKLTKFLQINFQEKLGLGSWYDDLNSDIKSYIKKGIIGIDDREYRYVLRTNLGVGQVTSTYLSERGINIPNCVMWFSMSKMYSSGASNNVVLHINYAEPLDNNELNGFATCEEWNNSNYFNQKQKDIISLFENRARTSFSITN